MKNRVLFLTGSLELGGIERLVRDLSIALNQTSEWEPGVCCLIRREGPFLSDLEKVRIPVFECKLEQRNLISFPLRLSRVISEFAPDIIHSHVDFSIPWQVLGIRIGGGKNIVWTQHNQYQNWEKSKFASFRIRSYFTFIWPFISAYTAVSKGVQKSVSGLSGRKPSDFQVIYNPVNVFTFSPGFQKRLIAREIMGISKSQFVIGNVARFAKQKGHSFLIQAAKTIIQFIPESRFILVGDGPLRDMIETKVKKYGLEDHFSFLGLRNDIHAILPGFDVFVLPSLWEGLGIAIIESMACGLPVIASDVGGIPEVLGDTGVLVPPADPEALAEAIINLYSQPELRQKMGKAARKFVIEKFSLDKILQQYINLYQEI